MIVGFFANLDGWDITAIVVGSWVILAALLAPRVGRALRDDVEIRQPSDRSWYCSDGRWRTEAEAADWASATEGSEAWDVDALPEWINDHAEPLYVPRSWTA